MIRGEFYWSVYFFDDSGTKLVVYGIDPAAWCQGGGVFDEWSYQANLLPTDDIIKDLTKGDDVQTSVWPFGNFDCYLFINVPPLEALLPLPPHLVVIGLDKTVEGCRARVSWPVQATRLCGQDDAPCLPQRGRTSPACPQVVRSARVRSRMPSWNSAVPGSAVPG